MAFLLLQFHDGLFVIFLSTHVGFPNAISGPVILNTVQTYIPPRPPNNTHFGDVLVWLFFSARPPVFGSDWVEAALLPSLSSSSNTGLAPTELGDSRTKPGKERRGGGGDNGPSQKREDEDGGRGRATPKNIERATGHQMGRIRNVKTASQPGNNNNKKTSIDRRRGVWGFKKKKRKCVSAISAVIV